MVLPETGDALVAPTVVTDAYGGGGSEKISNDFGGQ